MSLFYNAKIVVLLLPLLALGQSIQSICAAFQGGLNCGGVITVPTGAEIKNCPNKVFEVDDCKTKQTLYKFCPTVRKPFRTCPAGWTCVPGTNENWINVPCGLNIKTRDMSICDAAVQTAGLSDSAMKLAGSVCECVPKALELMKSGLSGDAGADPGLTASSGTTLSQYAQALKCVLDNGFAVRDNKHELLTSGALASAKRAIVLQAAEIDLAEYTRFAYAVGPCVLGVCNPGPVVAFFMDYLAKSRARMSDQLGTLFNPWIGLLNEIRQAIGNLDQTLDRLAQLNQRLQRETKAFQQDHCQNITMCVDDVSMRFYNKVLQISDYQQLLVHVKDAGDISAAVTEIQKLAQSLAQTRASRPNRLMLLRLANARQLMSIADLAKVIRRVYDLPTVFSHLGEALSSTSKFTKQLRGLGQVALDNVTQITSDVWLKDPGAVGKARDDIIQMQATLRREVVPTVAHVMSNITRISQVLDNFPWDGKLNIDPKASVASYQRWSPVSVDMPCSRMERANYNMGGFSGSFDYPKFYRCHYGTTLHWPNHHIPYIRIEF